MGAAGSCMSSGGGTMQTEAYGKASQIKMEPEQYELLMQSVTQLSNIKDGPTSVGIIAFKGLFVVDPETFGIFEFEEADWEHSHHFIHHCKTVMMTIIHVIKVFADEEKLVRNMDVMGMRHSMLNLPGRHFELLGIEMLKGLEEVLGEKFTPAAKEAWGLMYTILSDMLQGRMKKYNKDVGYTMNLTEE